MKTDKQVLGLIFIFTSITAFFSVLTWGGFSAEVLNGIFSSDEFVFEEEIGDYRNIYFNEKDTDLMSYLFRASENEVVFCLYGRINNSNIFIQELQETTMVERSKNSVRYVRCEQTSDYIGTIHTHPSGTCRLSPRVDWYAFGRDGGQISGVMCGEKTFVIYHKEDVFNPLNVIVGDST